MSSVSERVAPTRGPSGPGELPVRMPPSVETYRSSDQFASRVWQRGTVLALFDVLGASLAALFGLCASVWVRDLFGLAQPRDIVTAPVLMAVFSVPTAVIVGASLRKGHYIRIKPFWTEARELIRMVAYASALAVGLTFVLKSEVSRIWLVSTFASLLLLAPLARASAKGFMRWTGRWFVPLVIAGDRDLLDDSERAITSDFTLGYRVAARVDATHLSGVSDDIAQSELAAPLIELAGRYRKPRLLLAFDHRDVLETQQTIVEAVAGHFEHIVVAKQMYGLPAINAEPLCIDRHDTLFFRFSPRGIARHDAAVKRAIDVVGASLALVLAAPLLAGLALWVRRDGGRAVYGSERVGRNGRRFSCYKLRSMREDGHEILARHLERDAGARAEWQAGFKLRDDPRITPAGRFLRRTSLDELPQFFNVLRGDMSLVGPRPILPDEVPGYGRSLSIYQGVRPGLTGLWQTSGRSDLDYEDRVRLNKWYVRNWSLWLDVSILARTLPAVMASRGAV